MFQSTFKNVTFNFTTNNPRKVYSSGDIITGTVSFDLTKETKINSVAIGLSGKADVHWSTGGGGGGGRRRRRTRRHHSAKIDYFDIKHVLMQQNNAVGGTPKLQRGTHVYPFTCQIPQGDYPSTFHGFSGRIQYLLTLSIDRPWHFAKTFESEINFAQRLITYQPELWAPLTGFNSMTVCCLCWASGPVELRATLEKKAFVPGETVKIICEINNASSRRVTPRVKLQQKQTCYTLQRGSSTHVKKILVKETGEPISPNTTDVHKELMLTIPPTAMLTISNCAIVEVHYIIEVILDVRGSTRVIVLCPIVICDNSIYNDSQYTPQQL